MAKAKSQLFAALDTYVREQEVLSGAPATESEFAKLVILIQQPERSCQRCILLQNDISLLMAEKATSDKNYIKLKPAAKNSSCFNAEEMKKRISEAEKLAEHYKQHVSLMRDILCPKGRKSLLSVEEQRTLKFDLESNLWLDRPESSVEPSQDNSVLEAKENMSPINQERVMSLTNQSPSGMVHVGDPHDDVIQRADFRLHSFAVKKAKRAEICHACQERIKFGISIHKCKVCQQVSHLECRDTLPCIPVASAHRKKHDGDLATYCPASFPRVPSLVVHCIQEVERRGLNEEGIYRVPGSGVEVKELKDKLLRGHKVAPNLSKIKDIHVICSVLKDFLRTLNEPLLTYQLHGAFSFAAGMSNQEDALAQFLQVIALLPPANKDTLSALVLHLKKVAAHQQSNIMSVENLAKVFGPSIVGNSCADLELAVILHDTQRQAKIVQQIMQISASNFWEEYANPMAVQCDITVTSRSPSISLNYEPKGPENIIPGHAQASRRITML